MSTVAYTRRKVVVSVRFRPEAPSTWYNVCMSADEKPTRWYHLGIAYLGIGALGLSICTAATVVFAVLVSVCASGGQSVWPG